MATLPLLGIPDAARAAFSDTFIEQILTSYDGDSDVQFLMFRDHSCEYPAPVAEVAHGVVAAFDQDGSYVGDVLEFPAHVALSGSCVWLVATPAWQSTAGITADVAMAPGVLPTGGGMICYGGGPGTVPQDPSTWDRTDFGNYLECMAYGSYAGPANPALVTQSDEAADGHGLIRTSGFSSFVCQHPTGVRNVAGNTAAVAATSPCGYRAAGKVKLLRSTSGAEKLTYVALFGARVGLVGSGEDPSVFGATIDVVSGTQGNAAFSVPAGVGNPGWRVDAGTPYDTGQTFKFVNHDAPAGPTVVKLLRLHRTTQPGITSGKIKLVARSTGVSMLAPHGTVGIRVTTGMVQTCTTFATAEPNGDVPGRFVSSEYLVGSDSCSDATFMGP